MRARTLTSFFALGAFTVLAFGSLGDDTFDLSSFTQGGGASGPSGMGGHSAAANLAACQAHVEAWNSAECLQSAQKPDDFCDSFNNNLVDYTTYFECMTENVACEGAVPKLDGLKNCNVDL